MAQRLINIGVVGNDGTGDSIREAFRQTNQNFTELYALFGIGGEFNFTDLDDGPSELGQNKIPVSNSEGSRLLMKSLIGGTAIDITQTDTSITISSEASKVYNDTAPRLYNSMDANGKAIINLKYPLDPLTQEGIAFYTSLKNQYELSGTLSEVAGTIAANKQFVEDTVNNATCSIINLYVATTGTDTSTSPYKGRSKAFAFRSIRAASAYAKTLVDAYTRSLSSFKNTLTYTFNDVIDNVTIDAIVLNQNEIEITIVDGPIDQGIYPNNMLLPGKYLRGKTSNALAILKSYDSVAANTKIYAQVVSGTFVEDEELEYGYSRNSLHITIHVESGTYEEEFPIVVAENVTIIGDENNVVIVPTDTTISSDLYFYRSTTFDGLTIGSTVYHNHYDGLENYQVDAFLLNNGSIIKNLTLKESNAFLAVLDPGAIILYTYPQVINCKTIAKTTNNKNFAGGVYADGFAGRVPFTVVGKTSNTELTVINVNKSPNVQTLFSYLNSLYKVDNVIIDGDGSGTVYLNSVTPYSSTISVSFTPYFETAGEKTIIVKNCDFYNDYGYGVIANNGSKCVVIDTNTEFCFVGLGSFNGGNITSEGSTSSFGIYGLYARGYNTYIPTNTAKLTDNSIQKAVIYRPNDNGSTYKDTNANFGAQGASKFVIINYDYVPYPGSEVEIYHSTAGRTYYNIAFVELTTDTGSLANPTKMAICYLNSIGNEKVLAETLVDGKYVLIRNKKTVKVQELSDSFEVKGTVACRLNTGSEYYSLTSLSTAYYLDKVRTDSGYGTKETLGSGIKLIHITNELYYIPVTVISASGTEVIINQLSSYLASKIIGYQLCYLTTNGNTQVSTTIDQYTESSGVYKLIVANTVSSFSGVVYCGPKAHTVQVPELFNIYYNASTIIAQSHTFNNIGSGGIVSSNIPNDILGDPVTSLIDPNLLTSTSNTYELEGGRIYSTGMDLDGNYNIGNVISIDQKSKNVSFLHDTSIKNINGFGFTTGAVVNEFSTDDSFASNRNNVIPTESAIRTYIDRRLGLTHNQTLTTSNLVIAQGFIARSGQLAMLGNLDLGSYKITNLATPVLNTDGANKYYVDDKAQIRKLSDTNISNLQNNNILLYYNNKWNNASVIGDVSVSTNDGRTAYFTLESGVITNDNVATNANISYTKLNLRLASTAQTGVCYFNNSHFEVNEFGRVSLLNQAEYDPNSLLGNLDTITAAPEFVTFSDAVLYGDGLQHGLFNDPLAAIGSKGLMTVVQTGPGFVNTYEITKYSVEATANYIVQRDSVGAIKANSLYLNTSKVLNYNNGTLELFTPGALKFMSAYGTSVNSSTISLSGQFVLTAGSTFQATYADIAEYYEADGEYTPGTVMIFGGTKEVTLSTLYADSRVAGVVTEHPSYVLNTTCRLPRACVALTGKVKVNVTGKVKKGDILITSNVPGYAISNKVKLEPGIIIGKALEDHEADGRGTIYASIMRS